MKQRPAPLSVLAATLLCAAGAQAHDPDPLAACERLNQDTTVPRHSEIAYRLSSIVNI